MYQFEFEPAEGVPLLSADPFPIAWFVAVASQGQPFRHEVYLNPKPAIARQIERHGRDDQSL